MTIEDNYTDLAQRYDKLKHHSVRQRKELRRMNRTINRIGEVQRDAIRLMDLDGLKIDNRELRKTIRARGTVMIGLGIGYIILMIGLLL